MAFNNRTTLVTSGELLTGYMFLDSEILWEALQASGSDTAHMYPEGNKRLAMIGDAALKLAILDALRSRNLPRGSMDSIVQRIVNNTNLERVGRRIHLEDLVNRNPSQQGDVPPRTVSDTLESILGAVHLDSGSDIGAVLLVMANLGLWPEESQPSASL
ncbi:hypothetical protein VE04_03498 [Pseudogymnoascus sp. 24MN13]|nr:hypothetical protein VE04_03498 [Pseudogymnoascus sp. 24MN13]